MPISGILQPEVIPVQEGLRLRKWDAIPEAALGWYQDPELVYLVDGVREPYSREKLERMYRYLENHGELYAIEAWDAGSWKPIGDVTFRQEDMPIVIGDPAYRGKHVGRDVVKALIRRGRELGYSRLLVEEIYEYNPGSRKCFESAGFSVLEKTQKGNRFYLDL